MTWDAYTVFSVLCGLSCLGVGIFSKEIKRKDRFWAMAGGIFFVVYGMYVASQTSGTFVFPIVIFIAPFALAAKIIYDGAQRSKTRD